VDLPDSNIGPDTLPSDQNAVELLSQKDTTEENAIACSDNSATPKNDEFQFLFPDGRGETDAFLLESGKPCDKEQCADEGSHKNKELNLFADKSSQTETSYSDDGKLTG
jgi:hypothetical protein